MVNPVVHIKACQSQPVLWGKYKQYIPTVTKMKKSNDYGWNIRNNDSLSNNVLSMSHETSKTVRKVVVVLVSAMIAVL